MGTAGAAEPGWSVLEHGGAEHRKDGGRHRRSERHGRGEAERVTEVVVVEHGAPIA
jgi:hypothetical protein